MTTPSVNPTKESSVGSKSSQELSKVWYYLINNEQKGPCLLENLIALYQRHEISDATLVWSEGMEQWMPLAVTIKLTPTPVAPATLTPTYAASPLNPTHPTKKGFFISEKTVLGIVVVVVIGMLLWKFANVANNVTRPQKSTLTTVSSKPNQQTAQQDTSVKSVAIEQSSYQVASEVAINQNEAQTADDILKTTYPTSFDCKKARSVSENLICHDAELAAADSEIASILFKQAKAAATDKAAFTRLASKQWKYREKNCFDKACLTAWYGDMKVTLNQIALTGNADIGGETPPHSTSLAGQNMYEYDGNGWRYDETRSKWVSARDDGRTDITVKYRDGRVK